jgi:hypothetical protein
MPCSPLKVSHNLGKRRLPLQGRRISKARRNQHQSKQQAEPLGFQRTTQQYDPEDRTLWPPLFESEITTRNYKFVCSFFKFLGVGWHWVHLVRWTQKQKSMCFNVQFHMFTLWDTVQIVQISFWINFSKRVGYVIWFYFVGIPYSAKTYLVIRMWSRHFVSLWGGCVCGFSFFF